MKQEGFFQFYFNRGGDDIFRQWRGIMMCVLRAARGRGQESQQPFRRPSCGLLRARGKFWLSGHNLRDSVALQMLPTALLSIGSSAMQENA
jgi:hypothetical protein